MANVLPLSTALVDGSLIPRNTNNLLEAHAPTSLCGWVGFQNEAVHKCACLPDHLGLPSMQLVLIEPQNRPQPTRR